MSKAAKEDKNAVMKPVALPTLPRCDENNRAKWVSEYDKVEAELLKTHVPGSGTTTLGLRQIPATFDRTIPPPDIETEGDERRRRRAAGIPRARTTDPGASAGGPSAPDSPYGSPVGSPMRRPRSARATNAGARLATATPLPSKGTHDVLRLLFTLLDPPMDFKSSVGVDLRGIDLRWLKGYDTGDRMPTLNTIETFRDDPGDVPPINSPRSAIVVLRNGVAAPDLQVRPVHEFRTLDTSEEEAESRCRHHEERRAALLESLRDEYRELSATLPLFDLLDEVPAFRQGEWNTSAGKGRGADERRRFTEYAEGRRRERLEAAQREKLIKHEIAEKRRAAAAERFHSVIEERRRAAAGATKAGTRGLSPRSAAIAEEEHARKLAAQAEAKREMAERKRQQQAAQHEQQQHEAKQRALRNEHRMRKNRELLEQQQREQEAAQAARDEAARQRREAVERDRAMRREQQLEASRRAAELRNAAKEKARQHEAKVRADAEARRMRADERLHAFSSFKHAQQQQNASMEAAKREHRLQAARRAEEQRAQERARLMRRQHETDERVADMRERRAAEMGAARLQHQLEAEDKHFLVERQRR
eukprot:CAMPEP_0174845072 /NCGR_PEP_ID=MMETSP1114-20130205/11500_1 /TAXON_ID=312471 /ORGANISM="Neobodo designis, Strain CCAP 1951/1" /LENGTH=591 /DNA_ID=CAMNT_0016079319 /DNA_START=76 /DNA_END=1847 /DNA_ORIENTATION=+